MDSHLSFPDWLHSQIYFPPLFTLFLFILLFHSFPPFLEYSAPFHHISSIFAFPTQSCNPVPTAFPAAPYFPSRQSISELGLMLMLILISGLIFARFHKKNKYWREVKLFFQPLLLHRAGRRKLQLHLHPHRHLLGEKMSQKEKNEKKKKEKTIPTGIYWVRKCLKKKKQNNLQRHLLGENMSQN